MIHASVKAAWPEHSKAFEGRVPGMYCDILGLITCGQGNLIDPISAAERLPWTLEDGSKADLAQVRADWHLLKSGAAHFSKLHWKYALAATKCRLTDAAVDALVEAKLEENAAFLQSHHFPAFASFPADAQLGILSMAWAVGPGFPTKFGNFKAAVLAGSWEGAEACCKIREEGNPGVVPRNAANRLCFRNAHMSELSGADPTVLFWPATAPKAGTVEAQQALDMAQKEAAIKLAAWQALETSPPVVPGAGAALREYEQAGLTDDEPKS